MTDDTDIFISYADADAEWTRTWLLPKIEAQGLRVTTANDLLAGGARIEQIAREAENSKHTLLVLTPDWVINQWETFTGLIARSADPVGRQRKTIPLLRQRCEPPRSIARLVSADFTSGESSDWEKEFSRLLAVLSGQRSRTTLGPPLGALIGAEAPTNFKFPQNRHFVGRDQELAALHDLLDDAVPLGVNAARTTSTVAGLIGLGGVGKTQLVVEYIYRYGKSYPGGIFWINAADGVEDDFIEIGRIIAGYQIENKDEKKKEKEPDELIRIASDYLRSDPDVLLVVDNLNEPALLNQPVADTLTPISLPCRLLFTTRRRDLRGLRSIAVDMLTEAEALTLLLRSRPAILEHEHPEHATAVQLCATLGGLPLAIEMAAAYLEQEEDVTLSGYLKRLGKEGSLQTLDTLEQAKDWSPTWHDPIQITLLSQWDTLTNPEARLLLQAASLMPEAAAIPLARLSLLTGLSVAAEEGYPSPLASALRRLHIYSLIETLEGDQVRLHPLVREFARTQVTDIAGFFSQCAENVATALEDMLRVDSEVKLRGVDELLKDIKFGLKFHPGNATLEELRLILTKEKHNLPGYYIEGYPGFFLQQMRRRAFSTGNASLLRRIESALDTLQVPWLRERFQKTRESQALLQTLEVEMDRYYDPVAVRRERVKFGVIVTPDEKFAITVGDGRYTLRGDEGQIIVLRDLESGEFLRVFQKPMGESEYFVAIAITPDGQGMHCLSNFNHLQLWDIHSGQSLRNLRLKTEMFSSSTRMAITPDGKHAVVGYHNGMLDLRDLETGECIRSFEKHTSSVTSVAVTSDGKHAVSGSEDASLRLLDLETGQCLRTFQGHKSEVTSVAITPDGKYAVSASKDQTLRLWDLKKGKGLTSLQRIWKRGDQSLRSFTGHTGEINSLAVSPDGKRIVSASFDKTLRLWNIESGECLSIFHGHTSNVISASITSDGKRAISGSYDGTLRLWDLETAQKPQTMESHNGQVTGVAITPDGKFAVSASKDETLRLWDLKSGEGLRIFKGHKAGINAVAMIPNGKRFISASSGNLRMWDIKMGKSLHIFESEDFEVHNLDKSGKETGKGWKISVDHNAVVVTPDGRYAVSASGDALTRIHQLYLWDLENRKSLGTFGKHEDMITCVAVTSDSKRVVSACRDGFVRVWGLKSGECLRAFKVSEDMHILNLPIAITPDDRFLLVNTGSLEFWDLDIGQRLRTISTRSGSSNGLVITENGKYCVSRSYDGLTLFDLETGQQLLLFVSEQFDCAQVDKVGLFIVAGSETGAVHIFDIVDYGKR